MAMILSFKFDNNIKIIEVSKKGETLSFLSCMCIDSSCVKDGKIIDMNGTVNAIGERLKTKGIKTKKAVFIINSSKIMIRTIKLPFLKKSTEILSMIQIELQQMVSADLSKYKIMYEISNVTNENKILYAKYIVYCVPKILVSDYIDLAARLKLKLSKIDIFPNCINALYKNNIKINGGSLNNAETAVFINVNKNRISFSVAHKGFCDFHISTELWERPTEIAEKPVSQHGYSEIELEFLSQYRYSESELDFLSQYRYSESEAAPLPQCEGSVSETVQLSKYEYSKNKAEPLLQCEGSESEAAPLPQCEGSKNKTVPLSQCEYPENKTVPLPQCNSESKTLSQLPSNSKDLSFDSSLFTAQIAKFLRYYYSVSGNRSIEKIYIYGNNNRELRETIKTNLNLKSEIIESISSLIGETRSDNFCLIKYFNNVLTLFSPGNELIQNPNRSLKLINYCTYAGILLIIAAASTVLFGFFNSRAAMRNELTAMNSFIDEGRNNEVFSAIEGIKDETDYLKLYLQQAEELKSAAAENDYVDTNILREIHRMKPFKSRVTSIYSDKGSTQLMCLSPSMSEAALFFSKLRGLDLVESANMPAIQSKSGQHFSYTIVLKLKK